MVGYIINEKALEDLNDIYIYTARRWSVEQADFYYNSILNEIGNVVQDFDNARELFSIRRNYRFSKVYSHLIFFSKNDQAEIEVIRILHQKMDFKTHL